MCNKSFLPTPHLYHSILGIRPSHAGSLTHYHVVSMLPHGCFQPNQRLGWDLGNQKELIEQVSESHMLKLSLDDLFQVKFLKSVFLGLSN